MTVTRNATRGNIIFGYSKSGERHTYRCYGDMFGWSGQIVAEESEARRYRAMYPHAYAVGAFAVGIISVGYREYLRFNTWMQDYMTYLLAAKVGDAVPVMSVMALGKGFARLGIPQGGIEFGNVVGKAAYRQTLPFEAANDPLDISQTVRVSTFEAPKSGVDFNTDYFYPESKYILAEGSQSVAAGVGAAVAGNSPPYDQTIVEPGTDTGPDDGSAGGDDVGGAAAGSVTGAAAAAVGGAKPPSPTGFIPPIIGAFSGPVISILTGGGL